MALVKIRFANGTEKEVSDHLAFNPDIQKAQNFVVVGENGEVIKVEAKEPEKKNVEVVVEPIQSVTEIASDVVNEATSEDTPQPKKRGRKPKTNI